MVINYLFEYNIICEIHFNKFLAVFDRKNGYFLGFNEEIYYLVSSEIKYYLLGIESIKKPNRAHIPAQDIMSEFRDFVVLPVS